MSTDYVILLVRISKATPRTIYDYTNADDIGLINCVKNYNFDNVDFSQPIIKQADSFTKILQDAFVEFIPTKTVYILPNDQSWCNSFTCLLLRKNRLITMRSKPDYVEFVLL